ncbi:MAG: hypothetical protein Edafosvirus46_1, partial [Edafosvirus sp.]
MDNIFLDTKLIRKFIGLNIDLCNASGDNLLKKLCEQREENLIIEVINKIIEDNKNNKHIFNYYDIIYCSYVNQMVDLIDFLIKKKINININFACSKNFSITPLILICMDRIMLNITTESLILKLISNGADLTSTYVDRNNQTKNFLIRLCELGSENFIYRVLSIPNINFDLGNIINHH